MPNPNVFTLRFVNARAHIAAQYMLLDARMFGWSSLPGYRLEVNQDERTLILKDAAMRDRLVIGETFRFVEGAR